MRKEIHPEYREILFVDSTTDEKYLVGTTLKPKGNKTEVFEGSEYPVQMVDVSRSSHPFFNNQKGRFLDSEGRVNKFYKRYPQKKAQGEAEPAKELAPNLEKNPPASQQPKPAVEKKEAPKARAKVPSRKS